MSPEYAYEGLFSVKSDAFSFGVLLLEIVSGKRSAGFRQIGSWYNLLAYVSEYLFSFLFLLLLSNYLEI